MMVSPVRQFTPVKPSGQTQLKTVSEIEVQFAAGEQAPLVQPFYKAESKGPYKGYILTRDTTLKQRHESYEIVTND